MTTESDRERDSPAPPRRERWRQIDALFAASLDRQPEERADFLVQQCQGDPDLQRSVEELLENDRLAGDFLESPPLAQARGSESATEAERVSAGEVIGPYRIEHEIARGGMGSVYLAYRADDAYQRQVAIKLLDRASEATIRRFRSERQILANFDHPNIGKLFEGGETPAGRSYLVMEYVDGEPIDDYCDHHALTVEQRLRMFGKVCSAVHYAHQNLIVHRDIKPGNVLVNASGEPRLLDFGIAKWLDPEAFPGSLDRTATGERPMTPPYASPEQVRGEPITTASDVYSLGVLLYKLLTGRLPHRLTGLSVLEIERKLTDETPIQASLAVSSPRGSDDDLLPVIGTANARPQQLARRLAGDLDNIVAMALRREPDRRYGSVEQLARDVEHHLTGRPVLARRDTLGYRTGLLLRRHKLITASTALILFMILAFSTATARQAAETARQRDRAQLERDKAKQVSAFLVDIFRDSNPWRAPGNELTVHEALDRGAAKIDTELVDQPQVQATLQEAIGTVYLQLGLHEQASPQLEASLETRLTQLGQDHPDVASLMVKVATLHRRRADYPEAERLCLRALEILENASSEAAVEASTAHNTLSNLYRVQGRFAEAQEHSERALKILEQTHGPEHPDVAVVRVTLAGIAARQGDPATALAQLERALEIQLKTGNEINLRTAAIYANLGTLHLEAGALERAKPLLERSLEIHQKLLPEPHPTLAGLFVVLANLARAQDEHALAEQRLRRALDDYEKTLGAAHHLVANGLYLLGSVVAHQGRADDAAPLFQRSLEIREQVLGPDHHFVAETLLGLGQLRADQGHNSDAEQHFLRALSLWEQQPRQQGTQGVPEAYAAFLRATSRAAEAAEVEGRAASVSSEN